MKPFTARERIRLLLADVDGTLVTQEKILMFNKSGMSIAMGNASKEVQEKANFVTRSNEENGFTFAVEKFVLGSSNVQVGSLGTVQD
jgi:hydroxymethylpyrimidine pyrophosphatase-like HAD family hydrolase